MNPQRPPSSRNGTAGIIKHKHNQKKKKKNAIVFLLLFFQVSQVAFSFVNSTPFFFLLFFLSHVADPTVRDTARVHGLHGNVGVVPTLGLLLVAYAAGPHAVAGW